MLRTDQERGLNTDDWTVEQFAETPLNKIYEAVSDADWYQWEFDNVVEHHIFGNLENMVAADVYHGLTTSEVINGVADLIVEGGEGGYSRSQAFNKLVSICPPELIPS